MPEHDALANWNGQFMPLGEVRVSVLDRSYMFGDAVYEAIRVYNRKLWLEQAHFRRMQMSLDGIGIVCDVDRLMKKTHETVEKSGVKFGVIYIQVSRGEAPRSHVPPKGLTPNELIFIEDVPLDIFDALRMRGLRAGIHEDLRWRNCHLKTVNLLGNCLAASAAADKGYDDCLLYNTDGFVTEGVHSTFFGVLNGTILTTPLSHEILPGTTRELVIQLAHDVGMKTSESKVHKDVLPMLDEIFLAGTLSEILPIVELDGEKIADGKPGEFAIRLQAEISNKIKML